MREGWLYWRDSFPGDSRHYYVRRRSLCRRYRLENDVDALQGDRDHQANCHECQRQANRCSSREKVSEGLLLVKVLEMQRDDLVQAQKNKYDGYQEQIDAITEDILRRKVLETEPAEPLK